MPDESRGLAPRHTRRRRTRRSASPGVLVREAGVGDVEPIVRLRHALAREEARTGSAARPDAGAPDRLRALTERQLADPDGVIFLALAGAREVGILRCADGGRDTPAGRTALVTTAFVAVSHRRRGVLRALMARAEAWSRERGARWLRLRVGAGNGPGQAAWSSLGFTPQAVLMRRPVSGD